MSGAPPPSFDLERDYRDQWDLSGFPRLNHGSYGATPRAVLARKAALETVFNHDREAFMREELPVRLRAEREAVAEFVGATPSNLVLLDNVTEAINTVMHSLLLSAGDEVMVTDHLYPSYLPLWREWAARRGVRILVVPLGYPLADTEEVIEALLAKAGARTRLLIIDHIASPTALCFPVREIVSAFAARGIDCFVDGAHAPGQIEMNVESLGAAYYAGNNHKWMCAPMGSGFLHVRPDRQDAIMPAVGSGDAHRGQPFVERFSWQGSRDLLARLCVADTLETVGAMMPSGWAEIRARNHALVLAGRDIMRAALEVVLPDAGDPAGSMLTIPLGSLTFPADIEEMASTYRLRTLLERRHGFGVWATAFGGQYLLRLSAHLYNRLDDYRRLAEVLPPLIREIRRKEEVTE